MRKIPKVKNLVIKIGSNILSDSAKGINEDRVQKIADVVSQLKERVPHISIVSSGAIVAGFKFLGFQKRPSGIVDKQASAAVGQARLMWYYEHAFAKHSQTVAQILITKHDFSARQRYLNAKATIERLLSLNAIPIINENDTVVVNELKYVESFGDNDNLSALVAGLIDADMLIILSDVDGLFTADPTQDPTAELISDVEKIDKKVISLSGNSSSGVGTGGMHSKLNAAQKALQSGCPVVILNGRDPRNILRFLDGERVGTFFTDVGKRSGSKKLWLQYATIPQGALVIDDGARNALVDKHSSLLPSGVVEVNGEFKKGDIVRVLDQNGAETAVGMVRFSSEDLQKIKMKRSSEVVQILGRKASSVVIHCDEIGLSPKETDG